MSVPFYDIHSHHLHFDPEVVRISNYLISEMEYPVQTKNFVSAGLHPWKADRFNDSVLREMQGLAENKKIKAFGEIGLDTFRKENYEKQEKAFEEQLSLTNDFNLPVILHSVKSSDKIIAYRKQNPKNNWIFHAFHKNIVEANRLIDKNICISFGHSLVTASNKLCECVRKIDLEHVFFEIDESLIPIQRIYSKFAEIRGVSVESLKEQIHKNYKRVFEK